MLMLAAPPSVQDKFAAVFGSPTFGADDGRGQALKVIAAVYAHRRIEALGNDAIFCGHAIITGRLDNFLRRQIANQFCKVRNREARVGLHCAQAVIAVGGGGVDIRLNR